LKKRIKITQVLAVNKRLQALGITPRYTFMLGYPTETREEIQQTVSLISRLLEENPQLLKSVHTYTPLPGTELFELAVQHGLQVPGRLEDWIRFNYREVNLPWLSEEMRKLIEMITCCSVFLDKHFFFNPEVNIAPFYKFLGKMYYPIAKWRVDHLNYEFPLDFRLMEWLRLYRKQTL